MVGITPLANDYVIPSPGSKPVTPVSALITPPTIQRVITPPTMQPFIPPPAMQPVIPPPTMQLVTAPSATEPVTPPPAGSYDNPIDCCGSSDEEGLPSPLYRLTANGFSVTKI